MAKKLKTDKAHGKASSKLTRPARLVSVAASSATLRAASMSQHKAGVKAKTLANTGAHVALKYVKRKDAISAGRESMQRLARTYEILAK